jgi:hypothetical protein
VKRFALRIRLLTQALAVAVGILLALPLNGAAAAGPAICTDGIYQGGANAWRSWYGGKVARALCDMEVGRGDTVPLGPDNLPATYLHVCDELYVGGNDISWAEIRANALGRTAAVNECFGFSQANGTGTTVWLVDHPVACRDGWISPTAGVGQVPGEPITDVDPSVCALHGGPD